MNEVEEYISNFSQEIKERMETIRNLFFEINPNTIEYISYKIPTFKMGKNKLFFAGFKNHIGFYPIYGLEELEIEMDVYKPKNTKSSLHFSHEKPLPIELIKKIILLKSK